MKISNLMVSKKKWQKYFSDMSQIYYRTVAKFEIRVEHSVYKVAWIAWLRSKRCFCFDWSIDHDLLHLKLIKSNKLLTFCFRSILSNSRHFLRLISNWSMSIFISFCLEKKKNKQTTANQKQSWNFLVLIGQISISRNPIRALFNLVPFCRLVGGNCYYYFFLFFFCVPTALQLFIVLATTSGFRSCIMLSLRYSILLLRTLWSSHVARYWLFSWRDKARIYVYVSKYASVYHTSPRVSRDKHNLSIYIYATYSLRANDVIRDLSIRPGQDNNK